MSEKTDAGKPDWRTREAARRRRYDARLEADRAANRTALQKISDVTARRAQAESDPSTDPLWEARKDRDAELARIAASRRHTHANLARRLQGSIRQRRPRGRPTEERRQRTPSGCEWRPCPAVVQGGAETVPI